MGHIKVAYSSSACWAKVADGRNWCDTVDGNQKSGKLTMLRLVVIHRYLQGCAHGGAENTPFP